MKKIITFGTFDLLHEGHIRILERAKKLGDYLIVGVSTDSLNAKKGKRSVFSESHRSACVKALKWVDEIFLEDSLEKKDEYIKEFCADVLVMGDDWKGQFDWVSCEVMYLERTEGVSSTDLKSSISENHKCRKLLFGDTYVQKHYACALSLVNEMTLANIAPIFTQHKELPRNVDCDALVYFNKPANAPPACYDSKPRILIDHGASNLKWFLASKERLQFFDEIITAGPEHVISLESFFDRETLKGIGIRSGGFIKAKELLSPPKYSREEICTKYSLAPEKPIILFVPTWHISANRDLHVAIQDLAGVDNHIACLHPETRHIDTSPLNVAANEAGVIDELLKHSDIVISDLSSTIFEAAGIRKPVLQILLREYSDNNATMFDYPYVAGSADLFVGGITCRPSNLKETVLQSVENYNDLLDSARPYQDRILEGTKIDDESSDQIVEELLNICDKSVDYGLARAERPDVVSSLSTVHRNLFYASNMLIAHAGGNYKKHHASNSKEAVKSALRAINAVELDFVKSKDGIIVAHDTYEEKYGLDAPFQETSTSHFLSKKFNGELSGMSAEEAIKLCCRPGKFLVCDIKNMRQEYSDIAAEIYRIAEDLDCLEYIVIQCYCLEDFIALERLGFPHRLLAVWKYFYRSPLDDAAYDFARECLRINRGSVIGISIPYINKHMPCPTDESPSLGRWQALWKRLYLHGAPMDKYAYILRKNFGVFADAVSERFEFSDCIPGFNWKDYLYLNSGLVDAGIDNQISAIQHYLAYGQREGRYCQFDVPSGFNWNDYINKNPDLRRNGITGVNSAKAHWTRFGSKEQRVF